MAIISAKLSIPAKLKTQIDGRSKAQKLRWIVQRHGEAAARTARGLVPVKTGALQGSIHGVYGKGGTYSYTVTADARNSKGKGYGSFVENGTFFMAAQPFMKPALEQERPLFLKDAQKELGFK
jgi:HK97 gp10 family phage protein